MSGADGPPLVSVVIPALDESERLPALLDDLAALSVSAEVIVVDGGSIDGTAATARKGGARVLTSPPGRGGQLRAGAREARGRWLFFAHADSRLPPAARRALEEFLAREDEEAFAHFAFHLEGGGWARRGIEWGQRVRELITGLVYGDQGLVVARVLYDAVGGYPAWPLMEDVELVRRLRRKGCRVRLPAALPTSPRRYQEESWWRAWLRNVILVTLFHLGRPPERLARWYQPHGAARRSEEERVLLVFAKAPRPGRVKTRLARDIGDVAAATVYSKLAREVVDRVRRGSYRVVVCYDPPEAEREIVAWLGAEGERQPQVVGDLGARMAAALARALQSAARACVIGADIPDLDASLVEEAFACLTDADVVIGPATDGGYYLLGLRVLRTELFRDVPWGTDGVLEITLSRAEALGLKVHLLRELSDVDTADDLVGAGLAEYASGQAL